ncbi:protein of unknown function [Candidatus Hydrogenisulfobacillus filiaventi]|uniref:Uncharacterized protein n=1 Tax=Candidatus Hydrogenisulfobacillus filiaventi TaxID=2707344 RepID=A0A6F8ZK28_9FIRM|nr:protein of unknown function [Candidatus Hydrogenisulfobacillus filiaventi]
MWKTSLPHSIADPGLNPVGWGLGDSARDDPPAVGAGGPRAGATAGESAEAAGLRPGQTGGPPPAPAGADGQRSGQRRWHAGW